MAKKNTKPAASNEAPAFRETVADVVIPDGIVDTSDITTVKPDNVEVKKHKVVEFVNVQKKTLITVGITAGATLILALGGVALVNAFMPAPVGTTVVSVDTGGRQQQTNVSVKPEDLNNKTIEVPPGTEVELDIPNPEDTLNWQGQTSNSNVAAYINGARLDNLLKRPSVFGNSPGTAIITVTNQATGEIIIFNIEVKQP